MRPDRILLQATNPAQAQAMSAAVMTLARQRAIKAVKQKGLRCANVMIEMESGNDRRLCTRLDGWPDA